MTLLVVEFSLVGTRPCLLNGVEGRFLGIFWLVIPQMLNFALKCPRSPERKDGMSLAGKWFVWVLGAQRIPGLVFFWLLLELSVCVGSMKFLVAIRLAMSTN